MDGIIDIIILILVGVVPAVFKAIGNRLEKAGSDKAGKFRRIAEAMTDDDTGIFDEADAPVVEDMFMEPDPVVVVTPEEPAVMREDVVSQIKTTRRPEHIRPTNRKPLMLIEDEPEKKGEKIDPKKLVIYSEIMKPKF